MAEFASGMSARLKAALCAWPKADTEARPSFLEGEVSTRPVSRRDQQTFSKLRDVRPPLFHAMTCVQLTRQQHKTPSRRQQKRHPRVPLESALFPGLKGPPWWRVCLLAVGGFTVRGNVQAFAFCFLADTQTNHQVNQLECNHGNHCGPYDGDQHALGLDQDLAGD